MADVELGGGGLGSVGVGVGVGVVCGGAGVVRSTRKAQGRARWRTGFPMCQLGLSPEADVCVKPGHKAGMLGCCGLG